MKLVISMVLFVLSTSSIHAAECLYINSYHQGYAWSDKIETAVLAGLQGHCHVQVIRMDTKHHTSAAFGKKKALEIKAIMDANPPDVVIASDDNTSKYLLAPYFRNSHIPFVFCGINWTAQDYGYPYDNTTGMIEVSPIKDLLSEAKRMFQNIQRVAFIAVKGVHTDEKEFAWMSRIYGRQGIQVVPFYVRTMAQWKQAYQQAQAFDFIVLNNIAGIADWNHQDAVAYLLTHSHKLTVTTYDFMAKYSMLSMTKCAKEQGEWAAQVAIYLLAGEKARDIPIVANEKYHLYMNPTLLAAASIRLLSGIRFHATRVQP